ncbi:hypothetical protein [Massilia suwonensis]|uniref:Uncharacterized protein n=1 Tax=Massilia suwonensis TaxID=648895 RepID=A0ABW0MIN0_9BURK
MKTVLLISFLMSCSLSQITSAQNTPAPAQPGMGMGMGMDKMPMPMKKDAAKPGMAMEGTPMGTDKQMATMQGALPVALVDPGIDVNASIFLIEEP